MERNNEVTSCMKFIGIYVRPYARKVARKKIEVERKHELIMVPTVLYVVLI